MIEVNASPESTVALVLTAHGDRGGSGANKHLASHAEALKERGDFAGVFYGVLNGEPTVEQALDEADTCGAKEIVVYPVFMSAGYFVNTVLAERVSAAGLRTPTGIMQPLGLDKRLALLMLEHSLRASKSAGIDPAGARLLIVGHGSKKGEESADATKRAARLLSPHSPYARVETAFIEESPFLAETLERYDGTSVVAGFLSGEGLHGGEDIPEAIKESGARALYTGPIGLHPRVPELILSSLRQALAGPEEQPAESPPAAPQPAPIQVGSPDSELRAERVETPETKPARRARRRAGPMRLLFKAAAALVMMAVLATVAVPFFVPQDVIRDQVIAVVKQQTGRDVTVSGKTSFAIFPNVGVELEDVAISNPPGMDAGEMLRMEHLNLNLKLMPLLARRVEVDRFVLVRPVFNLVVDAKGRKNWDFQKTASLDPGAGEATAKKAAAERPRKMMQAQTGGFGGAAVRDISLGTVKITDGTVNYSDRITGVKHRVKAVNVTLVQPELTAPLDADGDLVWQGEKIDFDGRLVSVSALLSDQSTKAKFNVSSRHGKGSFDGTFGLAPSLTAKGVVSGETPSLRGLAGWLGNPLPPGGGLGPVSISGNLGLAGETLTFKKARVGFDGMNGTGQVNVRLKGVRPYVTASLNLDKLDLNPYVEDGATAPVRAVRPAQPAAQGPAPKSGESLTDFIKKLESDQGDAPQPQVRAWSQRALNLTGLRAVDADLRLTTGAIHFRNIRTGDSDVAADIKSGVLTANLTRLSLYSGTGTGRVTLNGARAISGVVASFNLKGISALPLLRDASGFDWVSGRANMTLSVSGNGRSQSEIMRSLQGQGQFAFSNGAIEGINIPELVRGLKQGQFDGWKRSSREKTDFSQLSASFVIRQGVASNSDLQMIGPLIRMSGEGIVDLGNERLDYSALPRIVASLEGQGAQFDPNKGLAVPIKITGPWARPKVVPDLERLLRDPELAQDTVNKVGKVLEKLKNKEDVNKLLQGVLGGGNQQPAPDGSQPPSQGQPATPEDLLRRFIR